MRLCRPRWRSAGRGGPGSREGEGALGVDDHPALGDCLEEVRLGEAAVIIEVEELEGLEEEGIDADFGRGFEL